MAPAPGGRLELLPHYIAATLAVVAAVVATRTLTGGLGFAVELAVVVAVVLLYPTVARALGVAPSAWRREDREADADATGTDDS